MVTGVGGQATSTLRDFEAALSGVPDKETFEVPNDREFKGGGLDQRGLGFHLKHMHRIQTNTTHNYNQIKQTTNATNIHKPEAEIV